MLVWLPAMIVVLLNVSGLWNRLQTEAAIEEYEYTEYAELLQSRDMTLSISEEEYNKLRASLLERNRIYGDANYQAYLERVGAESENTLTEAEFRAVQNGSATELRATLDYDFSEEKKFSYKNLSMDGIIHHLAVFISRLWQIHVFGEGNTRTTAVFFIKYLRTLGFDVTNDIFAENAWYFRNSLVRANYNDLKNGIHETTEYGRWAAVKMCDLPKISDR
jgi:prophage maintenance system killer protein